MFSDEAFGTNLRQFRLERLKLMTSSMIPDDIAGVKIDPDVIYQEEFKSQILQIRALVMAAKREEGPYVMEDRVVAVESVPERPVRDGLLLWLTRHTPDLVSRFFLRRLRLREIPERRIVRMQELHYYGCPHIHIGNDKTDVHLMWMATQSGQITPDGSGQDA